MIFSPAPKPKHRPQRKRFSHRRDYRYQAYIRTQSCCICQRMPVECAHVHSRGAGGSDRGNCVPFCAWHHHEQHTIGTMSFQRKYGCQLGFYALWYELQYPLA